MFRGAQGGYTILEIMIVFGVSIVILAAAYVTVGSVNGKTEFSQSMRDINSKLISWMGDVSNGFPGNANIDYNCQLDGSKRPQIRAGGASTTPDCVFIGKVIQFTSNAATCGGCQTGNLYAYSVFGRRTNDAAALSENLYDANPEPATGTIPGTKDLTGVYAMQAGTTIKSVEAEQTDDITKWVPVHLLGFTQSFNAHPSAANGAQDIYVYANLAADSPPGNASGDDAVRSCIEILATGTCPKPVAQDANTWPLALHSFRACFVSAYDSSKTALITISTTSDGYGPQTKLEFVSC